MEGRYKDMAKKVVIAGSVSLKEEIRKWVDFWTNEGQEVIDYPEALDKETFFDVYPDMKREFFKNVEETDIFFVVNEDKNGIEGYIGAETFAELVLALSQNLIHGKSIQIVLAKMPSEKIQSIEEIKMWLELGWIELLGERVLAKEC